MKGPLDIRCLLNKGAHLPCSEYGESPDSGQHELTFNLLDADIGGHFKKPALAHHCTPNKDFLYFKKATLKQTSSTSICHNKMIDFICFNDTSGISGGNGPS